MSGRFLFGESLGRKIAGFLISSIIIIGAFSTLLQVGARSTQKNSLDISENEGILPSEGISRTDANSQLCQESRLARIDRDSQNSAASGMQEMLIEDEGQLIHESSSVMASSADSFTVKGKFVFNSDPRFAHSSIVEEPVQFAKVTLWCTNPMPDSWPFIADGRTDESGVYSFTVPWQLWHFGTGIDVYVIVSAKNGVVEVWDDPAWIPDWWPGHDGAIYSFNTETKPVQAGSIVDMGKVVVSHAGAFHILNTLTKGWDFITEETGAHPGHVDVFWGDRFIKDRSYYYPRSTPTKLGEWGWLKEKAAAVAGFFLDLAGVLDSIVGIHVQDDYLDEWNEELLLHEYAHFLMDHPYASIWPPYSKTDHWYEVVSDEATAWVEGWADFFSAAARQYSGFGLTGQEFHINVDAYYQDQSSPDVLKKNVQVLVTDPLGRKIGYDPVLGIQFSEIEGANIGWKDNGDKVNTYVTFRWPVEGVYRVDFWRDSSGIGTLNYDVEASILSPFHDYYLWETDRLAEPGSHSSWMPFVSYEVEDNQRGANLEAAVASTLWDLYNGYRSNDPTDPFCHVTLARIFSTLCTPVETIEYWTDNPILGWRKFTLYVYISSIYEFRDLLVEKYPALKTPSWAVFNLHGVAQPDSVPPTNPKSFEFSHPPGQETWGARIRAVLLDTGTDDLSGVCAYGYLWDNSVDTVLPIPGCSVLFPPDGPVIISPPLTQDIDWYFHLRTVDNAGNWASETYTAGPFRVKIEDQDDDTTGPTLSNPVAYISEKDWGILNGDVARGSFVYLTFGIDAEDLSGISHLEFRLRYKDRVLKSTDTRGPYGKTYYGDIQISAPWNYADKLPTGIEITFEVFAVDDDSEGWEDKSSTLAKFNATLQELPHDYTVQSLPFLNFTIANWPLEVLIVAPNGLRMGHDSRTGLDMSEIYPAFVYGSMPEQFLIPSPIEGDYTIEVLGMEAGPCSIFMQYVDANGTIITSTRLEGKIEPGTLKTQKIELGTNDAIDDASPPVLSIALAGSLALNDWYVSDVNVTITSTDDMSGVAMTEYSTNGEDWINYSEPFTIGVEGATCLYCHTIDNRGNRGFFFSEVKIDKSPPILNKIYPSPGLAIQGDVVFQINATDKASGISSLNLTVYDEFGNPLGNVENPAFLDPDTGYWNLTLNVPNLVNGYSRAIAEMEDEAGNLKSMTLLYGLTLVNPLCLNLGSSKLCFNATIELPEGYAAGDIDTATTRLNRTVTLLSGAPTIIGNVDNDTFPDLTVSFNRTAVLEYLLSVGATRGNVTLTVDGRLTDEVSFEGSIVVIVKIPGDTNLNGEVNIIDAIVAANAFGSNPGCSNWNCVVDESEDNEIDIFDMILIANNFGRTQL